MPELSRHAIDAETALARLTAGNERFINNVRSIESLGSTSRRDELLKGQSPYAILLACSDSRVPAELVFDCGLGDLFVVRVAGNVVAPSIVGSVEFAAATYDSELVVVMGHTLCGAINATVDVLTRGRKITSENIHDIVERIAPSVEELVASGLAGDKLVHAATHANIRASVSHLRHGSRLIEKRIAEGRLTVVGAEYELETGRVVFFDI